MPLNSLRFGEIVKSLAIEKYRGSKGAKDIVSVLSLDIGSAHMHFADGVGYFYCFSGICCQLLDLARTYYIVPIIQYTARDINDYGLPVQVKYLSLSPSAYESDLLLKQSIAQKTGTSIDKQDMLITCTDESYQKLVFQTLGPCIMA